jgi:hypothetical protein
MKKLSFLALAAAGMLMVGCTSKDDVASEGSLTKDVGEGYLAISINLPTTPQVLTRATDDNGAGNFDLDDGLDAEFEVNSAYLLVFTPSTASDATEDDATLKTAFKLTTGWETNPDPHVTKNSDKVVHKVGSLVAEGDLALVVLNPNNILSFEMKSGSDDQINEQTVTFNNENLIGQYFGFIKELLVETDKLGAEPMTKIDFYMANSPLFTKKGSTKTDDPTGTEFRTLVPIDHVYPTEDDARSGEASEIFVERGMAKVTVRAGSATMKLETKAKDENAQMDITFNGWSLDQTNTVSFLIRSTKNVNDTYVDANIDDRFEGLINGVCKIYRFTGNTAILESNNPGAYKYRGYFAIDPNYNRDTEVAATGNELTHFTGADASGYKSFGLEAPQYCFENTFDVAHQLRKNTTLAQLKVTIGNDGADLYIVNGSKSTIYKAATLQTLIKAEVLNVLAENSKFATGVDKTDIDSDTDLEDVTLTPDNADATKVKVTGATVKTTSAGKFVSGVNDFLATTAAINAINSRVGNIVIYSGGVSYYAIRIKHFGDNLTPWHVGTKAAPIGEWNTSWPDDGKEAVLPTAGNSYPNNNANDYLGRYGVLRNNWYDIVVNSIKTLGSAKPIDYTTDPTPDDELEGYINVQINILSWARRTQSWDL